MVTGRLIRKLVAMFHRTERNDMGDKGGKSGDGHIEDDTESAPVCLLKLIKYSCF